MVSAAFRAGVVLLTVTAAFCVRFWWTSEPVAPVRAVIEPIEIAADGLESAILTIQAPAVPRITVSDERLGVRVERLTGHGELWLARVRSGVAPGVVELKVAAGGAPAETVRLSLLPYLGDRERDGTPDALRLESDQDRQAFRRWFTFLAEVQFFQDETARPAEINDCAALIRYAYREALRSHDHRWVAGARLPLILGLDSVAKYSYPYTLLGPALFRTKPGPFRETDLTDGTFTQFADAKTLQTFNTHFVSRDLRRAGPGDLLFFRHESSAMPFHSMIYLGQSQIRNDGAEYLVYHTGPDDGDPGEMRRPAVEELLRHPDPAWHPLAGNPAFLGVYRWNFLR